MDFRLGRTVDGSRDVSVVGEEGFAPLIQLGDMVVFFEGREAIGFDRMKVKSIWQCRHGAFHHDEIVGKPFGSRVFSRTTKGYVYALSCTPESWSHVVPNRTQIVQDFDQSIVIFRLDLKPGDVVVESGTGSGVMSSAIMRTIAPRGFLHSFEFNDIRAARAQEEFEENGLGGLVKVAHRDVCAERSDGGGFGEELDGKADAVFLDLPEPWLAVAHAKVTLKPGKKVCSYSPCIEQVMKSCEALRSEGFHSVTTIEFRLRTINYAEVQLEVPDFGSPETAPMSSSVTATSSASEIHSGKQRQTKEPVVERGDNGEVRSGTAVADIRGLPESSSGECVSSSASSGAPENVHEAARPIDGENRISQEGTTEQDGTVPTTVTNTTFEVHVTSASHDDPTTSVKRPREEATDDRGVPHEERVFNAGRGRNERLLPKAARAAAAVGGQKGPPKFVCAQPFPTMRGHTAFLTFAIRPLTPVSATAGAGTTAEVQAVPPLTSIGIAEGGQGASRSIDGLSDEVRTL